MRSMCPFVSSPTSLPMSALGQWQHVVVASIAPWGAQQRRCSHKAGNELLYAHEGVRQHTQSQPGPGLVEHLPAGRAPGGGWGGGTGGGDGGRISKLAGVGWAPAVLEPSQLEGVPWMNVRSSSTVPLFGPP